METSALATMLLNASAELGDLIDAAERCAGLTDEEIQRIVEGDCTDTLLLARLCNAINCEITIGPGFQMHARSTGRFRLRGSSCLP